MRKPTFPEILSGIDAMRKPTLAELCSGLLATTLWLAVILLAVEAL